MKTACARDDLAFIAVAARLFCASPSSSALRTSSMSSTRISVLPSRMYPWPATRELPTGAPPRSKSVISSPKISTYDTAILEVTPRARFLSAAAANISSHALGTRPLLSEFWSSSPNMV